MEPLQIELPTLSHTQQLAEHLAAALTQPNSLPMVLALCGTLGVGKTELARSLAAQLGVDREAVTSPTYVLVQQYKGRIPVYHLDFYRLDHSGQVWDLGLDEWLEEPALVMIEWADKFPDTWPSQWLRVDLVVDDRGQRLAGLTAQGSRAVRMLELIKSNRIGH